LQAEEKPVRGNAASTFRRKVLPFAEEEKTTPWVAGGKVSRHCDSQRVRADVDALRMWGVGRVDSAFASGSPGQKVSVWQTKKEQWLPRRSGDEPALRIASEGVDLQAERSIPSPLRSTGRSKAESQLRAQSKSERRGTEMGRIDSG
jgi:hypothetical protein